MAKSKKISEQEHPLIFHFMNKERLTRYEIAAIFALIAEILAKRLRVHNFSEKELSATFEEVGKLLPLKVDPKCPVCASPYRWQYELYYLSCDGNLEWVLSATRSMNEPHITLKQLKNHFQKHFNPQLDISKTSQKSLEMITKREGPDFVEKVLSHFLFTDNFLEKLEKKLEQIVDKQDEIPSKEADLLKSLLITFLRYANWLRDFSQKNYQEVDKLGKLFPFEL
ncbi:hypothetical protein H5T87_09410 [bacterium]|nr:hypothetical protein [bacterium]